MARKLLLRGMLVGLVAGCVVFVLARWIGEPRVDRAIAFEEKLDQEKDQPKGDMPEAPIVSRKTQRGLGLLIGSLLYATAIGGLFGLAFGYAQGRLGNFRPRLLSILLAVVGFVSIVLIPTLKYPANPPSVGNPETIGIRTASFFLVIVFSVAATVLAIQTGRRLHSHWDTWNASLFAIGLYLAIMITACHFLPTFDEVPAGFPVTLMWEFRTASLEIQAAMWATIGLLFGWVMEKSLVERQS
jgi:predicted cobalt transporter CbtA